MNISNLFVNRLAIFILGSTLFINFFFIYGLNERFPGDLGDARFNQFILEHITQWLMNSNEAFSSPPFFYPFKNTLFFSDLHLGSVIFYTVPRMFGASRETAFNFWHLNGQILTLATSFLVLRRWRFSNSESLLGAFLFTLNLPALAQIEHAQLNYRFAIPLAIHSLFIWRSNPNWQNICPLFFWISLQCLLSIYLGFFLLIICLIILISWPFIKSNTVIPIELGLQKIKYKKKFEILNIVFLTFILILLFYILISYFFASQEYKLNREWITLLSMTPTPGSYLIADRSYLWSWIGANLDAGPVRHEHQLFIGFGFIFFILASVIRIHNFNSFSQLRILMAMTLVITLIITIQINFKTLYILFSQIPVYSSLRSVSRIIIVLCFPATILAAIGFHNLHNIKSNVSRLVQLVFVLLISLEIIFFRYATTNIYVADKRIETISKLVLEEIDQQQRKKILLASIVNKIEPFWVSTLDVMLVAQNLGLQSITGYSGNYPNNYRHFTSCSEITNYLTNIPSKKDVSSYLILVVSYKEDRELVNVEKCP